MKAPKFILILLSCLAALHLTVAGETTDADRKWAGVVEKLIAEGQRNFSTPSEARAQLAKQTAVKLGFKCEVAKNEDGFRIVVTQAVVGVDK
jgi:hypothetical protein